ncbi:MAG: CDGSH iron-sulfur domain-containing protein [Nitrospinae bacterium]|nr:CDGSH iron-sulfur domain-containing protein [Nitrospinota bacterium]
MSDQEGPLTITGKDSIWACTCMQSAHWPFCDASHHTFGGGEPVEIQLDPQKTYQLCQCYKTKNRPFCDGSHNK